MENNISSTEILFSEFPNVRSKCAHTITLQQFVDKLRSDTYQSQVLGYRQLCTEPGREAEAAAVKGNMPCIVPAGICSGGHAVVHFVQYSGIVCIDLDHTDSRTEEIMQTLQALPYVAAAFRSISGAGVKVFVRTTPHAGGYDPLYKAVGQAIGKAAAHPYDEKCKTLTQPCYYSYDPQAYYNPQAEAFVYVPQNETEERLKIPDSESDTEAQTEPADEEAVAKLIDYFEREFPFRAGQRHYICLKLGRTAGHRNFSHESLMLLIDNFAKRHAMSDFDENDIRSRVRAGYQYFNSQKEEQKQGDRAHFRAQAHYRGQMPTCEGENDMESIADFNEELRAELPDIPDEVFESLPEFLQRCVQNPMNNRERDIMLLSAIICCSALLPYISFF